MNQAQYYCRTIKRLCDNGALLPSEYQQVEYITMGGGSYINLDISLTRGVIGEMKINVTSGNFLNSAGLKDDTTSRYNRNYFSFFWDEYYRRYAIGMGAGGYNATQPTYSFNTDYTIAYNTVNHTAIINDVNYNFNSSWSDAQNPPYARWNWTIHAQPNSSGVPSVDSGTTILYYYKLADNNNVLKRDLYPCYRKSDYKPGMYDLVTRVFFTNAGTGEFTVGNNV